MKKFDAEKNNFDKMAVMRTLKTLFPACFNMGCDCVRTYTVVLMAYVF